MNMNKVAAIVSFWFGVKSVVAGDTCCYGVQCPAAVFVTTTSAIDSFTYNAGTEITSGSSLETNLAINVASCCPDGGWVVINYNGETTTDKMCRCWDIDYWYTQSSCIQSTYDGCAPTSSPTAEKCPDFAPYEVPGNSYSINSVAVCIIGEKIDVPPVISSEQRCDTENIICLKGADASWDGTYSRTVNDVAYAWPKYSKTDDATKFIQRGLGSYSYWIGNNDGTVEWSTISSLCGSSPYDYNIVGASCAFSVAGKISEFPLATIISGACPPPTASPTPQPSVAPTSTTDGPTSRPIGEPTAKPTQTITTTTTSDGTTTTGGPGQSAAWMVEMKWIWCFIITVFYLSF